MTRALLLLGAAAVVGTLLAVSAFAPAPSPYGSCPDAGIPFGKPIANAAERARVVGTFSQSTIQACWPGTLADSRP